MDETHRDYLRDLGHHIRVAAEESARVAKASSREAEDAFEQGRRLAYYEVVSLMLSQAIAFGLAAEELGMAGLDPERELFAADA